TVQTGTNTLQTNGTITGLAASTAGGTVATSMIGGKLLLAAATTVNVADAGAVPGLAIPAVISGAVSLTKGGAGTLIFNGSTANLYAGTTTVNVGTLVLDDSGGLAVPGNLIIGDFLGGSGAGKADVVRAFVPAQTITFGGGITGGTFALTFNGQTTGPITWDS